MKLNLGSNNVRVSGFLNVDHRKINEVDIVADVFTMKEFQDNSIEEILASHILEHVPFDKIIQVLKEWYRVLQINGIIWIEVPCLDIIYKIFQDAKKLREHGKKTDWIYLNSRLFGNAEVLKKMYGQEKYSYDMHKSTFTFEMLFDLLSIIGFKNVEQVAHTPQSLKCHHTAIVVKAQKG